MNSQESRSLYIAQGRQPSFCDMANIAFSSLLFDLSVGVFCWTEALYHRWLERLEKCPPRSRVEILDLFDTNRMTLLEFETTLETQKYDLVILHGFQAAYNLDQLSEDYVNSVFRAILSDMIIWA